MSEKCMFLETFNIFGLEDKPCCYLYHKYCSDVSNCYFKRMISAEKKLESHKYDFDLDTLWHGPNDWS